MIQHGPAPASLKIRDSSTVSPEIDADRCWISHDPQRMDFRRHSRGNVAQCAASECLGFLFLEIVDDIALRLVQMLVQILTTSARGSIFLLSQL